ncbi:MAG: LamG domain-containing protein [Acidobacteriota bacterium]
MVPIPHSTAATAGRSASLRRAFAPSQRLTTLAAAVALAAASSFALAPVAGATCVAAPSGLSAWWPLDTVNFGSSTPELVASNTAAIFGNPMTNVVGHVGQSFYFNISPDYLVAPDCRTADLGVGDFTLLAWVNTPQISPGTILSKYEIVNFQGSQQLIGYLFGVDDGEPTLSVRLPGAAGFPSTYYGFGMPPINSGQWHLVAVSVDRDSPTGLRFSVDGVQSPALFDPTPWQGSLSNSADLFIGRVDPNLSAGGFHFTANLDEIQIYKRALSPAEIQAIHGAGPDGVCKRRVPLLQSCGVGAAN